MAKKKKHEEHENLERWLVSYADFITLLFATFTALYALSVADLAKLKDVAQSIRDGFQSQSLISGIESIIQGKSAPSANTNPMSKETGEGDGLLGAHDSLTFTKGEVKKMKDTVANLKKSINVINENLKAAIGKKGGGPGGEEKPRGVELSVQERGIRISFDSSLLFEPGSAALKEESKKAIGLVANELKEYSKTHFVHVEGHTDNTPISTAVYPSNWELSTARASTVVRHLIGSHQFDPSHMAAVGYGDTRPFASNATPSGREKNRRIDLILYSGAAGKYVDVRKQYMTEQTLVKSEDDAETMKQLGKTPRPADTGQVIEVKDEDLPLKKPDIRPQIVPNIKKDLGIKDTPHENAPESGHESSHDHDAPKPEKKPDPKPAEKPSEKAADKPVELKKPVGKPGGGTQVTDSKPASKPAGGKKGGTLVKSADE